VAARGGVQECGSRALLRVPRSGWVPRGVEEAGGPSQSHLLDEVRTLRRAARAIVRDGGLSLPEKCLALLELGERAWLAQLPRFAESAAWAEGRGCLGDPDPDPWPRPADRLDRACRRLPRPAWSGARPASKSSSATWTSGGGPRFEPLRLRRRGLVSERWASCRHDRRPPDRRGSETSATRQGRGLAPSRRL